MFQNDTLYKLTYLLALLTYDHLHLCSAWN